MDHIIFKILPFREILFSIVHPFLSQFSEFKMNSEYFQQECGSTHFSQFVFIQNILHSCKGIFSIKIDIAQFLFLKKELYNRYT